MTHPLRLGIWALVHGNRAALNDPEEPYDASWERNRKPRARSRSARLRLHADRPAHRQSAPRRPRPARSLDLGGGTGGALQPHRDHHGDQADALSSGGAGQDGVADRGTSARAASRSTWSMPGTGKRDRECRHGVPRARRALCLWGEWLHGRRGADARRAGQLHGQVCSTSRTTRCMPKDSFRGRGRASMSAASPNRRGRSAPRQADVWFINGQPLDDVAALIADVGGRPRPAGAPLRFGLSAFVIARETEPKPRPPTSVCSALARRRRQTSRAYRESEHRRRRS